MQIKELLLPLIILGVGVVVCAAAGVYRANNAEAGVLTVALMVLLGLPLGMVVLFMAASWFQMSFGLLKTAILKYAASDMLATGVMLFVPNVIVLVIPIPLVTWVVVMTGLFIWLFDQDARDTFLAVFAMAVPKVILWLVVSMVASAA